MTIDPYSPPKANLESEQPRENAPALWNPGPMSVLSFFFTPIFGGIISMKNWQAMGEHEKAAQSKMWAIGAALVYVLVTAMQLLFPDSSTVNVLTKGGAIGFFIAWYMQSGKVQKEVIEVRYGSSFQKRGWTVPVLAAFGCYVAVFIFAFVAALVVYAVKA